MYCPNCGKRAPEDAIFCLRCGARILPAEKQSQETKSSNKKWKIIITTAVFFLIAAGACCLASVYIIKIQNENTQVNSAAADKSIVKEETKRNLETYYSFLGTDLNELNTESDDFRNGMENVCIMGETGTISYSVDENISNTQIRQMKWVDNKKSSEQDYRIFLSQIIEYYGAKGNLGNLDSYKARSWINYDSRSRVYCYYDNAQNTIIMQWDYNEHFAISDSDMERINSVKNEQTTSSSESPTEASVSTTATDPAAATAAVTNQDLIHDQNESSTDETINFITAKGYFDFSYDSYGVSNEDGDVIAYIEPDAEFTECLTDTDGEEYYEVPATVLYYPDESSGIEVQANIRFTDIASILVQANDKYFTEYSYDIEDFIIRYNGDWPFHDEFKNYLEKGKRNSIITFKIDSYDYSTGYIENATINIPYEE